MQVIAYYNTSMESVELCFIWTILMHHACNYSIFQQGVSGIIFLAKYTHVEQKF